MRAAGVAVRRKTVLGDSFAARLRERKHAHATGEHTRPADSGGQQTGEQASRRAAGRIIVLDMCMSLCILNITIYVRISDTSLYI